MTNAELALEYVRPGTTIGLGSGRSASAFVRALGEYVRNGLDVLGVPTSQATADLAAEVGVPLVTLEVEPELDLTVDGADEVDPDLNLIKGYGAALVREKIVAASSRSLIILIGPEKLVPALGTRGIVPVEVVPFALPFCRRTLPSLGVEAEPRVQDGKLVRTDNDNYIIDCRVGLISDPGSLERSILSVPGVVGTGLFVDMATRVLVDEGDGQVQTLERAGINAPES